MLKGYDHEPKIRPCDFEENQNAQFTFFSMFLWPMMFVSMINKITNFCLVVVLCAAIMAFYQALN